MMVYTLLLIILFVNCTIFTDTCVIITQSGFPEIQFNLQDGVFSMKYYSDNVFKEPDGNILKILKDSNGYRFKFYSDFIKIDLQSKEILGSKIRTERDSVYFDIYSVRNGVKIRQKGCCLERLGWNEERYGFYVGCMPCRNKKTQIFTIRPVLCEKENKTYQKVKINLNIINDD
ncbi:hypothetical protein TUBRATIS_23210 [Tubulinosema ratisbonensis]|uniref:Uncharacterized protein n=1 Tax=Tubulinosema ratisbonensis TaxID=291195 RepID=A0A437AJG8_9MICR|nr:hypothetical protein TUBRATIS_23210 [Tubulinosema ratisbonensis]